MEKRKGLLHPGGHFQHAVCAVLDEVVDEGVDALAVSLAAVAAYALGHGVGLDDAGADGVVQVVEEASGADKSR